MPAERRGSTSTPRSSTTPALGVGAGGQMPLWINEDDIIAGGSRANDYERIIDYLIDHGSAPDGIGFQGHFIEEWGRISTPQQVYNQIDRFAQNGLPLRTTEFDIDVGTAERGRSRASSCTTTWTAMFSHPDMEAITMWGFWQGSHWRPNAGALPQRLEREARAPGVPGSCVRRVVDRRDGHLGRAGEFDLRGFKGEYDLTVTVNGQTYVLPDVLLKDDATVQAMLPIVISPADFDGNFRVDGDDLANWTGGFGLTATAAKVDGDADNDHDVDGGDFLAWQQQFGAGVTPPAVAVPEPSTLALALVCLTAGSRICLPRRRPA